MVSTKLNDWMQLLGMLAIVASLLFVGLQIKQSQDIAIASQYQSRAESAMNYHLTGMEAGMSNAFFRTTPIEQMSPEQFNYGVSSNLWSWINLDNNYFQYESGFMSEEAWQSQRNRFRKFIANELFAATYLHEKSEYRSLFQQLCDQVLAEAADVQERELIE